jgi:hypothetical protein
VNVDTAIRPGQAVATIDARANPIVRASAIAEWAFFSVLCALAASVPNESLFGGYDRDTGVGFRSPSYYFGIIAVGLSVVFLPRLVRSFLSSTPMVLMTAAFSIALVVLAGFLITGEPHQRDYGIDRQYKSIYMALMMLVPAAHPVWRQRVRDAYFIGTFVFVAIAIVLVITGRASTSNHLYATRTAVLGMNENVQSIFAASGVLLALARALLERRTRYLVLWGALYLVGIAAFLLGSSRTGLVGLLLGHALIVALTLFGRSAAKKPLARVRIPIVVLLLIVSFVAVATEVQAVQTAVTSMETRSELALQGRDVGHRDILVAATMKLFLDNPAGVGMGRTWEFLQGSDPHNGYAKLAAEGGIAAILTFLLAQFALLRNTRKWIAVDSHEIGTAACFVLFSVSAATGQALAESPYWVFFALLAAAPRGPQRELLHADTSS